MAGSRITVCCTLSFSLVLLSGAVRPAEAWQSRDVQLTVNALVIASATRVEHAEVSALSTRSTGVNEREVQLLVTAGSSGESFLSLIPRVDGVTMELVSTDGRCTLLGPRGARVARTTGGKEFSSPVLLRLSSSSAELLEQASRVPVSLLVDSASR